MHIQKFTCGPVHTNCYLIWDEDERKAALIDTPKGCSARVFEELEKNWLELSLIINTHGHWDHIAENKILQEKTGAKIAVHRSDEKMLWYPKETMFALKTKIAIQPTRADIHLESKHVVRIGKIALEVIETPGHSPGSVCLYEAKSGTLFSGDTIFQASYGRTDFPGGDHRTMAASLKKLLKLPENTRVLPGHGNETAIASEKWIEEIL